MGKERVDVLLVEQGHFDSVKQAQSAIMAGIVYADGERIEKAGTLIPRLMSLSVKGARHPYVSRGGLKLEKAIRYFDINMNNKVMIDIGASTGGFSDCALQHGASFIYAIDVGYNQLAWSIRKSPQVQVMERTNFRYVQRKDLTGPQANFAAIDVSFISLDKILPPLLPLLTKESEVVALIKPQFEAPGHKVGESGVVRNTEVHKEVLHSVLTFASEIGFKLEGLTYSPITGGEGNIEFLVYWSLFDKEQSLALETTHDFSETIDHVVAAAQSELA